LFLSAPGLNLAPSEFRELLPILMAKIIMPDDILAVLGANGISAGSELGAALDSHVEKMLNEGA